MDKEFTKALNKTFENFGKDIVKEKRFVDIVSDYYPAMAVDHPARKKVLTAIIVEGFGNDILVCNNNVDARLCVDKYTALVSKKNGFDKKLVESMLLELCSTLSISVASPAQNRPANPINPQQNGKQTPKPVPTPPSNKGKSKGKPINKPAHPNKPITKPTNNSKGWNWIGVAF